MSCTFEVVETACLVGSIDGIEVYVGLGVGILVVGSSVGEYMGSDVGSSDGVVDDRKDGIVVGFVLVKIEGEVDGT